MNRKLRPTRSKGKKIEKNSLQRRNWHWQRAWERERGICTPWNRVRRGRRRNHRTKQQSETTPTAETAKTTSKKKNKNFRLSKQQGCKKIGTEIELSKTVSPYDSIGVSSAKQYVLCYLLIPSFHIKT